MARDGLRPAAIVREALLNATGGRIGTVALSCVVIALGATLSAVAAVDHASFTADQQVLTAAGGQVAVIASSTRAEVQIDRRSCERLANRSEVARAGLIWNSHRTVVGPTGLGVPVVEVSTSLVPELSASTAVIGIGLAAQMNPGHVVIDDVPVAAVPGSDQPEGIPLDAAIAVTAPISARSGERCLVEFEPGAESASALAAATAQIRVFGGPVIATLTHQDATSAVQRHLDRPSRWMSLLVGVLGGGLLALTIVGRQSAVASYRVSGVAPIALRWILTLETAWFAGLIAISNTAGLIALQAWHPSFAADALRGLAAACIALLVSAMATELVARRPLHRQLKDR
ncbi:hypothetical protein [Agrococcus baldri]|nr:hypothetical protein [Agrococcus baldri]